jgi:cell division protein FtsQ
MPRLKRKQPAQRTRLKRSAFSMQSLFRWFKTLGKVSALSLIILLPTVLWFKGGPDFFVNSLDTAVVNISGRLGLVVEDIVVEGRMQTSPQELFNVLMIRRGDPLLKCSPQQSKQQLEQLPWIQAATVQRRWPNTIYVRLGEKHPVALWQNNAKLFLIDEQGNIIDQQVGTEYADLLIVVGKGAPHHTVALLKELDKVAELRSQITAAIFVGERRWDLVLNNKLKVKLPEENIAHALSHLLKLEQSHKILKDEILAVDLRLSDRSFLVVSPEAMKQKEHIKETDT